MPDLVKIVADKNWGWNGDQCAVWGDAIIIGGTRDEKEAKARLIAGLTNPAALKVLWAAMCSMTQDVHCPQDNLSSEEWDLADRIFAQLDGVQNGRD